MDPGDAAAADPSTTPPGTPPTPPGASPTPPLGERGIPFDEWDHESWPLRTHAQRLEEIGIHLPPPESLDDAALHAALWELIRGLARLDTFLDRTDHLSDRELYTHLWYDSLREVIEAIPVGVGWACTLDILGGCSEDDIELSLKFYDSEEERQDWAREFPGYDIPPHETLPYDRDRHLPVSPNDRLAPEEGEPDLD